jgi:hypothetical protein
MMMSVTDEGFVWIYFSEPMMAPSNLTIIREEGLELELIPSDNSMDSKYLDFDWRVVDFYQTWMKIKIDFDYPYHISTLGKNGLDRLKVKVKKDS